MPSDLKNVTSPVQKNVSSPVRLTVCDYAAVNADGTCTIVRGGIDILLAAALPANILAWLFVEVDVGALDPGDHPVRTSIGIGEVTLFEVEGLLKINSLEVGARFVVPFSCSVQSFGLVRITLEIAGRLRAERIVTLKQQVEGIGS